MADSEHTNILPVNTLTVSAHPEPSAAGVSHLSASVSQEHTGLREPFASTHLALSTGVHRNTGHPEDAPAENLSSGSF